MTGLDRGRRHGCDDGGAQVRALAGRCLRGGRGMASSAAPAGAFVYSSHTALNNAPTSGISRVNLDGSSPHPTFINAAGAVPGGVAVDAAHIFGIAVDALSSAAPSPGPSSLPVPRFARTVNAELVSGTVRIRPAGEACVRAVELGIPAAVRHHRGCPSRPREDHGGGRRRRAPAGRRARRLELRRLRGGTAFDRAGASSERRAHLQAQDPPPVGRCQGPYVAARRR